jgi:hypothetical protein
MGFPEFVAAQPVALTHRFRYADREYISLKAKSRKAISVYV